MNPDDDILAGVGGRLRSLRRSRRITLSHLAEIVGVAESTLSRIESGRLLPTLAQLLPLARFHGLSLDALVDPRAHEGLACLPRFQRDGASFVRLTSQPGGIQAYRMSWHAQAAGALPELHRHRGFLSFNVLSGRLRLLVGEREIALGAGDVAELDTTTPHGMVSAGAQRVDALVLFGRQGERPRTAHGSAPGHRPHEHRAH